MISFDRFYAEIHPGLEPYPWQSALADRLAGERRSDDAATMPPLSIGVPTGSGKTSVIDALVWALAAQADRAPSERTVGVRIVWAIDRRLLVDEVAKQADDLARRLKTASADDTDALHEIAVRLDSLKGLPAPENGAEPTFHGVPLVVSRWRGGVAIPSPAQHPMQVEIITSTVAQIGSRMLFRGYGLGRGSLPVGAALAACDTTVCLDEAHLVAPFVETVTAIGTRRHRTGDTLAPATRLITLSATPQQPKSEASASTDAWLTSSGSDLPATDHVALTDADVAALGDRLTGPKWARLVPEPGTSDKEQEAALVAAIDEHLDAGRSTIACVVNSVRTARAVFDRVRKAHPSPDADVMLLIGPQRPVDRQRMLDGAMPGEGAPPRRAVLFDRAAPPCPLIVVATQTFEVGLDADVEALVTQSASGAALAQRLGRLNRAGTRVGHATIIRQTGFPLYEQDEEGAWAWLESLEPLDAAAATSDPETEATATGESAELPDRTVDVSVAALRRTPPPPPVTTDRAPELTDDTVRALVHTGDRPHALCDPDVDAFLRGATSDPSSDVSLCWRSDLYEDDDRPGADTYREALLRLAPPQPDEQLSLSVVAARRLIGIRTGQIRATATKERQLTEDAADVEGDARAVALGDIDDDARERRFEDIPFFVRRGRDLLRGRKPGDDPGVGMRLWDIQPGDLVVLPTALGGIDEFGMAVTSPDGTDVAADVLPRPADSDPDHGPSDDVENALDGTDRAESAPHPIRITRQALDVALADVIPSPGPRSQRIGRILRRTAAIENRIERARTSEGRFQATADLLELLKDHPAVAALTPQTVELRRLTPTVPPEWTDPVDDLAGLFLATDRGTLSPFLDADRSDDEVEHESDDPAPTAVLLDGEDPPMPTGGWVLVPIKRSSPEQVRPRGEDPPSLASHAQAVAERAEQFAQAAGLPDEIVRTITLAARVHDHGKADPRMQAFFRGGVAPPLADPLAKSVFGTDDRRADRTARKASGIPDRLRHEQASVAILEDALANDRVTGLPDLPGRGIDPELALHATSAHHGYARPWLPVPRGGTPARGFAVDIAGGTGTAHGDGREAWDDGASFRRFLTLNARYGPWTLAYLESLLVLADRTVSAEGR